MAQMTQSRRIRRAAFQALFQLDAAPEISDDELLASLAEVELSEGERRRVLALARGAFEQREDADRLMTELAPGWPAHRQPAVDRALLRLGWFEMASGRTPPKVAISEAVILAKAFGGEKSPSFVNGLLGEAMGRLRNQGGPTLRGGSEGEAAQTEQEVAAPDASAAGRPEAGVDEAGSPGMRESRHPGPDDEDGSEPGRRGAAAHPGSQED